MDKSCKSKGPEHHERPTKAQMKELDRVLPVHAIIAHMNNPCKEAPQNAKGARKMHKHRQRDFLPHVC